jgi:hypothetical protein
MTSAPAAELLTEPAEIKVPEPAFGLALAAAILCAVAGCLFPLYLLGIANIFFGHPAVNRWTVAAASLAGLSASAVLLWRAGILGAARQIQLYVPLSVKVILAVLAAPYLILCIISLWAYPTGCDPLAYHIDVPLKWLQDGSLRLNPAMGWKYALPSNAELAALIPLAFGWESLVSCGNLTAALLLGVSIYLVAWKLCRDASASLLTMAVAMSVSIIVNQAFELYVDLFGTAFLVAGVALLLWRSYRPDLFPFLSGCATGIAIGTKPTFWIYGALYLVGAVTFLLAADGQEERSRRRWRPVGLLMAGMLLFAGFWFFRAAAATGNPAYPMRIAIGRKVIFQGYARQDYQSDGLRSLGEVLSEPWTDPPLIPQIQASLPSSVSGVGCLFAAVAIPGLLYLALRILIRRATAPEFWLFIVAGIAFILWCTVLLRVIRFGLPVIMMTCTLSAVMLRDLIVHRRRSISCLILGGIVLNGIACVAAPLERTYLQLRMHDSSRATFYGYPPLIDRLPPRTRILDRTGQGAAFTLAGARLSNYVLSQDDLRSAQYVLKSGALDAEDSELHSLGARLIYNGVPRSLFPQVTPSWRVYRLP